MPIQDLIPTPAMSGWCRPNLVLLLAGLLALSACEKKQGSSSETGGGAAGGGATLSQAKDVSLDKFCPTLAERACASAAQAASATGRESEDPEKCRSRISDMCSIRIVEPAQSAIRAGRLEYDSDAAGKCLQVDPGKLSVEEKEKLYQTCVVQGVFRGKQEAGDMCKWAVECSVGTICTNAGKPQCGVQGTCAAYPKENESCDILTCDPSLHLDCVTLGTGKKACKPLAKKGEACSQDGSTLPRCMWSPDSSRNFLRFYGADTADPSVLNCVMGAQASPVEGGACMAYAQKGERCNMVGTGFPRCGGLTWCAGPPRQETCQPQPIEGDACSLDSTLAPCLINSAGKRLTCVGTGTQGTCQAPLASEGAPCSGPRALSESRSLSPAPPCDASKGLYCNGFPQGTCANSAKLGEPCGVSLASADDASRYTLVNCDEQTTICSGMTSTVIGKDSGGVFKYIAGGRCVARGDTGAVCSRVDAEPAADDNCKADLYCDSKSQTCKELVGESDIGELMEASWLCKWGT